MVMLLYTWQIPNFSLNFLHEKWSENIKILLRHNYHEDLKWKLYVVTYYKV